MGRSGLAVLAVGAALAAAAVVAPAAAADSTVVLTPVADTYVHASNKSTSYGTSSSLAAYGTPDVEALLRFALPAAPAGQALTGARLTFRTTALASAGTRDTLSVRVAADTWSESTTTYKTKPAVTGAVLGTLAGAPAVSTTYAVTLDPAQLGPQLGAPTTLALLGSGGDGLFFASREAAASSRPSLTLTFSPTGPPDTSPPDPPAEVDAVVTGSSVALDWVASADDVGTVAYDVYRSATSGFVPDVTNRVATVPTTTWTDNGLAAGDWFYLVQARDAAGNTSLPSPQEQATVVPPPPPPPTASTLTVSPAADTYVHGGNKTTSYGSSSSLSSYGTPDVESFLRFVVPATPPGQVLASASLRLQTTTLSSAGSGDTQRVRLSDNGWSEPTTTWATKPSVGAAVLGTLPGPTAVNTRYDIPLDPAQVLPLLGTTTTFAVVAAGGDGFWFSSREAPSSAVRPLLTLRFALGNPDTTPPTAPANLAAVTGASSVALTWDAATDDTAVTRYDVYRSTTPGFSPDAGSFLGSATGTTYSDPLKALGTFSYLVVARDASLNSSPASNEATAEVTMLPVVTTVAAFGDAACPPGYVVTATTCRQGDVAAVISDVNPDWMVPLGDLQYARGTYAELTGSWDRTFGVFRSRTLPVVGNHEFADNEGTGAAGYFDYLYGAGVSTGPFGDRGLGYYTTTLGSWQLIVLDSECGPDIENGQHAMAGGCAVGSPEYQWLSSTLDASTASCTLVAFHRPRWSTGPNASYAPMAAMWDLMVNKGVDVAISGHNHDTEVFAPIGVSGSTTTTPVLDPHGIRQFVAGTGGKDLTAFPSGSSGVTTATQARDSTTYGALVLTLRDGGYDWAYHPIAGRTYTNVRTSGAFSGTGETCH